MLAVASMSPVKSSLVRSDRAGSFDAPCSRDVTVFTGCHCHNLRMDADKRICGREPDSQYVELAVEVFAMLADATRVRIILALRDTELSVNELAEKLDKQPAAISQHLAK